MATNGSTATNGFSAANGTNPPLEDREAKRAWEEKCFRTLHNDYIQGKNRAIAYSEASAGLPNELEWTCTFEFKGVTYSAVSTKKQWAKDLAAKRLLEADVLE